MCKKQKMCKWYVCKTDKIYKYEQPETARNQHFIKFSHNFSTHLFTVLTIGVILSLEQMKNINNHLLSRAY